jgi:hypothetical protein
MNLMACEIRIISPGVYEIRSISGKIVHYRVDPIDGRWAVDEDPEHYRFQNESEAENRARLLCRDSHATACPMSAEESRLG